jgi:hypothetical protein
MVFSPPYLLFVIPGRASGSALCAARWSEPGIQM